MNARLLLLLSCLMLFVACKKHQWDTSRQYLVEGYLYSHTPEGAPLVNQKIAISQKKDTYSADDPAVITDSNGHFAIYYTANGKEDKISIYPTVSNYSCIYGNIDFISNLEKGKDLNLGKIYVR